MNPMHPILIFLIATGIAFSSSLARADWVGPMHDVKEFEISGVKLGMEVTDVVDNLIRFYGTTKESITIRERSGVPQRLLFSNKELEYSVKFIQWTTPDDQIKFVANEINVHQTKLNDSIVEASISKYGQASRISSYQGKNTKYYWCTEKTTDKRNNDCDKQTASLTLDKRHTLSLTTGYYAAILREEERRKFVYREVPFEPFNRGKLYSPVENKRQLPADKTQSLSGQDNCPEVWNKFLDFYGRALVVGENVEDRSQAWVGENSLNFSPFFNNELTNEEFFHRHIKHVLAIEQFLEVAVVCDDDKNHRYPTRFVAAQYLNKAGKLGRLILNDTNKGHYRVSFFIDTNNKHFQHAIKYNFFEPLPDDFSKTMDENIENLEKEYRF